MTAKPCKSCDQLRRENRRLTDMLAAQRSLNTRAGITDETPDVRVQNLLNALDAKQAKIDALMLEFCPGEMSREQRAEWERHQKPTETTSERWRYASFENPPHDHEWTDHAYCELCGLRYDSQPAETTAAVRTSMDYGGGPFNEDGIEGPAEKTDER